MVAYFNKIGGIGRTDRRADGMQHLTSPFGEGHINIIRWCLALTGCIAPRTFLPCLKRYAHFASNRWRSLLDDLFL